MTAVATTPARTIRMADVTPAMRLYRPRGAAKAVWSDRSDEILLSGPAGTGKSRANLEKLHACMEHWPGARGLILRKTRSSLSESALVTYEEKVLPEGSPIARGIQRRMRQVYRYPNGSEIIVGGLDDPTKIMSTEFDIAYVQEAIELTEADWELVTTRLRNSVMPFQQIIADTNPGAPTHWLRRRCEAGKCVLLESRHEDNPTLWDAEREEWTNGGATYIARLDKLSGARYWRLRRGRWAAAEGMVYGDWDAAVHLIDRFDIPAAWRRIRSIDFGFTNPFVCQWWAIDPDGRMYLYRELYDTQRLCSDWAADIVRLSEGERIEVTVADHDAEDRATLSAGRVHTMAAYKAVSVGIQAVQARLKTAGDGRARLFILRDALVQRSQRLEEAKLPCSTEEEIDGYVWPPGVDGKQAKEVPVDANNHGMDAKRYAVCYVDNIGNRPAFRTSSQLPAREEVPA